jgi:hypothetical protein
MDGDPSRLQNTSRTNSAYLPRSPHLTNSPLFLKAATDPHLVAAYMTGDVQTLRARKGPTAAFEKRDRTRLYPRRCRRRLSDKERCERRNRKRRLGGSSALPDTLRHHFTEGERSVLCVVSGQVKHHGVCDLSIDEIADRAGVGRTTVQNTLHEARRLSLVKITERPVRGKPSKTNLVEIASREWKIWISRAPSAASRIGSTFKNVNALKNIELRKKDAGNENGQGLRPSPAMNLQRYRNSAD